MANKKTDYVVGKGKTARHKIERRNYGEGEAIDLSHLDDATVAELVRMGVVVEKAKFPTDKPEVKNG